VSFCLFPFDSAIGDFCVAAGDPAAQLTAFETGLLDLVTNRNYTVHPVTMSESTGNVSRFQ